MESYGFGTEYNQQGVKVYAGYFSEGYKKIGFA